MKKNVLASIICAMTCQAAQASENTPLSGTSEKTNGEIVIDTVRENVQSILNVLTSSEMTFVDAVEKIASSTPEELDALLYSNSKPVENPSQKPTEQSAKESRAQGAGEAKKPAVSVMDKRRVHFSKKSTQLQGQSAEAAKRTGSSTTAPLVTQPIPTQQKSVVSTPQTKTSVSSSRTKRGGYFSQM